MKRHTHHLRVNVVITNGEKDVEFRGTKKIQIFNRPSHKYSAEKNYAKISFKKICKPVPDVEDINDLGEKLIIYINEEKILTGKKVEISDASVPTWTINLILADVTDHRDEIRDRFEILDFDKH